MDVVVAPLPHNKLPATVMLSVELPQLLATVTVGADGMALGVTVPIPAALVHPFTVVVTLYEPATVTVIEEVVAPVLQSKLPAAAVLRIELPQLLTAVTEGSDGELLIVSTNVAAESQPTALVK